MNGSRGRKGQLVDKRINGLKIVKRKCIDCEKERSSLELPNNVQNYNSDVSLSWRHGFVHAPFTIQIVERIGSFV